MNEYRVDYSRRWSLRDRRALFLSRLKGIVHGEEEEEEEEERAIPLFKITCSFHFKNKH